VLIAVATQSKARVVLDRSITGFEFRAVYGSLFAFLYFVFLCVGRGLAMDRSRVRGVILTVAPRFKKSLA
jgi:hypothetical protein